jgi:glycosyltransferase involved in cell wall biosynthesis
VKLAIISNVNGYQWAGSETVWHRAAIRALSMGHHVTAIIHRDLIPSGQIREFQTAGGSVLNWGALRIARFQNLKEHFFPSFAPKKLDRFDLILVSLGSLPALTYVPGLVDGLLKTRTPIVLLCQFNSDHLIISTREREVVAQVIKKAASTVFCSQRNMIEARRQFAIQSNHSSVIPNPIRNKGEEACPWPEDTEGVIFATVARLEVAWKGQDLLLDVLSQEQWKGRNWELRIYGVGPDREYLEKLADFYHLSERVSFKGHCENIRDIWSHSHLLLLPSHGEGTPLAALEAMMAARAVVATDVGGNSEVIRDGINGFIAEGATLTSFSKAMERAWEAKSTWQEMGATARRLMNEMAGSDSSEELLRLCERHTKKDVLIKSGRES